MAKPRRTTDHGTVILHGVIMLSFLIAVATGLRIATDDPVAEWLLALDAVLPVQDLWFRHLAAGTILTAALAGYGTYIRLGGLVARIRLDRARLVTMLRGGRSRWAALNVAVYWVLMLALVVEVVTGIALFAGAGRGVLAVHLNCTFVCIGAVVAHVGLHACYGGFAQLCRIFRPEPLVVAPPAADLGDLLAEELARKATAERGNAASAHDPGAGPEPRSTGAATLHASPLANAVAVALAMGTVLVGAEQTTRQTLVVSAIAPSEAPKLDGDISDPVWSKAKPVTVLTTQGGDFGGRYESNVEIRAVHDGIFAYVAIVWDDPTRSLKHMPLIKHRGRWYVAATRDDLADERQFHEDKLAVLLTQPGPALIGAAIHLARTPIAGLPGSSTGRGLHFTTGGALADVWQWRASHGGVVGHIDNCHFGAPAEATAGGRAGNQYSGGFALDPAPAGYTANFTEGSAGSGSPPIQPLRLPRDLSAVTAAMGRAGGKPGESESEGARWFMTEAESVPYSSELDAKVPDGTVLPSIVVPDRIPGTATSIRGTARWAGGRWTLELARRLYTGSRYDVPIKTGTLLWVAAFDHSEKRHTRHLRPFSLEVE